jgi:hypothetical protein
MPQTLRRICRLYGALLFPYPRDFRQRFGGEMAATFADQIRNKWNQSGLAGVSRVWRGAVWELFSVAVFLGSSALCLAFFRAVSFPCNK